MMWTVLKKLAVKERDLGHSRCRVRRGVFVLKEQSLELGREQWRRRG